MYELQMWHLVRTAALPISRTVQKKKMSTHAPQTKTGSSSEY